MREVVVKCHLHNQGHKDGGGGKHGHWEFVNACWYTSGPGILEANGIQLPPHFQLVDDLLSAN